VINKVILVGRLGKDPEMRFLPDSAAVAQFSVATQRIWRDEINEKHTETDWHTVVAWSRLAEVCSQYLYKGQLVYVEGRLQTRSWEGDDKVKHYRTEVVAEQVKFLERKTEDTTIPAMPEDDLPL
jgi:single-strand DNA-binding protein